MSESSTSRSLEACLEALVWALRQAWRASRAVPRTYACLKAERDEAPYPGCLASFAFGSLRAPTFGRRLRFLGRTPA